MDDTIWIHLLVEQGPLVALLVAFIVASYTGKVRFAREFKALEEINSRLGDVVRENTQTIGDAVQAVKKTIHVIRTEHRDHEPR